MSANASVAVKKITTNEKDDHKLLFVRYSLHNHNISSVAKKNPENILKFPHNKVQSLAHDKFYPQRETRIYRISIGNKPDSMDDSSHNHSQNIWD